MERLNNIKQLIVPTKNEHSQNSNEKATTDIIDPYQYKPKKYHHIKDLETLKQTLKNNKELSSLIPKLRYPPEILNQIPKVVADGLENIKQWSVNQDGEAHNKIRRALPYELMVYKLTKSYNGQWGLDAADKLIRQAFNKPNNPSREIDFHAEISCNIAKDLLCRVLGIKNASFELKNKMQIWSDRSADTALRFDLIENQEYYMEGHRFFLSTLDKVDLALKTNDQSEYDLDYGIMAKLLREKKITDRDLIANQCQQVVLGAFHNPSNLCSILIGLLLEHPEQIKELRRQVAADPKKVDELIHRASNEALRFLPPAHVIVRFATCPMQIKDKEIKQGDGIILHLEEANRNSVNDPLKFDIFRTDSIMNQHVGFGHGPHRCLGGETGQVTAECLLQQLFLDDILRPEYLQYKDMRNIQLKCFKWHRHGSFKEIESFIVTF